MMLRSAILSICIQKKSSCPHPPSLLRIGAPQDADTLVLSIRPKKSRKRLACDVFDTRSGIVYDVTDTDCSVKKGNIHGRVDATLKQLFVENRSEILLCASPVLHFDPL